MVDHTSEIDKRIRTLINQGESSEVEFKSARGDFPVVFGKAILLLQIQMAVQLFWG